MPAFIPLLLPLLLLIFLSWRGGPLLLLAPVMAALAAALASLPLLASLTQIFMPALGGFVISFFPLFLLGAVFGEVMKATGAATTLAHAIADALGTRHAIAAVVLACAILTYGGISLFVVAFAVFPLAAALFTQARLSAHLIPRPSRLGHSPSP
ncbi:GntT/GntP/DsdX family permease [Litoreibacter roseus]|uniref:GntP family permease n=1 Tax=Litoreibacter roseus TaxID=2601869 RepID=A0A6N6JHY3_9RHOB|nr:hypothetical protein [Litoreibacter roseus]GFE65009.1 hypothetical protein KIN_20830 [Litoreibacter roseus]